MLETNSAHTNCAQPEALQLSRPPKKPNNCYFADIIHTLWQSWGSGTLSNQLQLAQPPSGFSDEHLFFGGFCLGGGGLMLK